MVTECFEEAFEEFRCHDACPLLEHVLQMFVLV